MNKKRGYYTLNLGGKERVLHFSMNFWANFTEILDISLEEIATVFEKGVSLKAIRTLIYSGLLAYDQENGNEIDYNEYSVGSWLEDITPDDLEKIIASMMESKILGNELNVGLSRKGDNTKKK